MNCAEAYQILTNPIVNLGVSSLPGTPSGREISDALAISAAALLRARAEEETAPLTLDELWHMPGKSVWVHPVAWALVRRTVDPVSKREITEFLFSDKTTMPTMKCYAAGLFAYRQEREARLRNEDEC